MFRKIVAVWVSLAMLFGFVVIVDVVIDFTPRVRATTLYVNETGSGGAYTSIQDAINDSKDGDTVFVYSGIYYENVVVDRKISLIGENRDTTIINSNGVGNVVFVTVDWVNITGFTITNGGDNFKDAGVALPGVRKCTIIDNNISSNNGYGIRLSSSSNNNITGNNISSNNKYGIYLMLSTKNNIMDNNFVNDGIVIKGDQLSHYNSHDIATTNMVNNNPLFYYKDSSVINLDGIPVGQLILANCTDVEIKNLQISNTDTGIEVAYSTNVNITSSNISCNGYGIYLQSSSEVIITDNDISSNNWQGIYLFSSSNNNTILGNNMSNNFWGIYLSWSSNNNLIGNNLSLNKGNSIDLAQSSNNTITGNNIFLNNDVGIYSKLSSNNNIIMGNNVSGNNHGIYIGGSSDNILTSNTISSNNIWGITLSSSTNNNITCNNVSGNWDGILLSQSSNNKIYHNNIIDNTNQVSDDMNDNYWDNGYPSGGNYWSDYDGVDNFKGPNQDQPGSDGMGDTNYSIDGDSIDHYPLMEPYYDKHLENYTILKEGWNLISFPLIQDNQDLTKALEMIDGWYDAVQWHDISDTGDPWKHHKPGKPFGNDLFHLNETMGFWIHITHPGDTIFLYNGTQPTSNQTITLHPGWNMVGYPSLTSYNRTKGLNNITFDDQIDAIWSYDASTQKWKEITASDNFEVGEGYYIHAKSECEWEVPL